MYSDDEESKRKIDNSSDNKPINKHNDKPLEKEEDFYGDFYDYVNENGYDDDIENEPDLESSRKKATRMRVAITMILLIVLGVLVVLLTRSCDHKKVIKDETPEVIINNPTIELTVGEEEQIDYRYDNFKDEPTLTFTSMDEDVATVTEEGLVKGIKEGTTEIIISYFVDKVPQEKKCEVTIKKKEKEPDPEPKPEPEKPKDKKAPVITATIVDAKDNTWTNHDVTINVSAKDDSKVTLQYVLDCTNNCKYTNVSGGKITVTKTGTTIVNIQAKDSSNNKSTKKLTIKIDKDNPSCSLSVNSDGVVTAKPSDSNGILYSGFNSGYSGSNETSKKVAVGTHTYYVKDLAGNTSTCSISVKSKVQYRSRTCDIGHMTFTGWHQYSSVYTTRCSIYTKYESEKAGNTWYHARSNADASQCSGSSPCYLCTSYGRSLSGCNWGDEKWSSYQDTKPEESKKVQVEEKTIFYS